MVLGFPKYACKMSERLKLLLPSRLVHFRFQIRNLALRELFEAFVYCRDN